MPLIRKYADWFEEDSGDRKSLGDLLVRRASIRTINELTREFEKEAR
jgi:hypothetical protein